MGQRVLRLLQNLTLSLAALILALGTGEILARVFLPEPPGVIVAHGGDVDPAVAADMSPFAAIHPAFALHYGTATGRRLHPNVHMVIDKPPGGDTPVVIRTNSLGYLNPEVGPKTRTRALFLGDSITAQYFTPDEQSLVRLVQTFAGERGLDLETINAAVGGISLKTELAILTESGLGVEPDIVVINFYLNDFADSPGVYMPPLPAPLDKSWLLRHIVVASIALGAPVGQEQGARTTTAFALEQKTWRSEFLRSNPQGPGDYRTEEGAFNRLITRHFLDWGGAWSPKAWEVMVPLFTEFRRLAKRHSFRLVVVAFPVSYQVEAEYLYDYPQCQLREIARRLDIPLLDLLPLLRRQGPGAVDRLFQDHCHLTPEGTRVLGAAVAEFLVSLRR